MRLPPNPILIAAKRWLDLLPTSGGVSRARALLTGLSTYSDLTPTQYATALTWIRDTRLIEKVRSDVPSSQLILRALLEGGGLSWVQDADQLVRDPSELPSDISAAGAALGLDANEVYVQLRDSWGKVDTAARERVGAAGELALVELLEQSTDARVTQVSARSDGYGYDIEVVKDGAAAHLEVKSTTRRGRITIYLSRNEFDVMLRDDRWSLVLVHLNPNLIVVGTGCVPRQWIIDHAPRDVDALGSWASCKLEVPLEVVENTIPRLQEMLARPLPLWE